MPMKTDIVRVVLDIQETCRQLTRVLGADDLPEARRLVTRIGERVRDLDSLITVYIATIDVGR